MTSRNILGFPVGASGTTSPTISISGSNIGFAPFAVAPLEVHVDTAGALYTGLGSSYGGGVEKFAPGANGNAVPVQSISADYNTYTGLTSFDVAPDQSLWMLYQQTNSGLPGVLKHFPSNFSDLVGPIGIVQGSNTQLGYPRCVRVGTNGQIYITTADGATATPLNPRVVIYAPNANGNIVPTAVIVGNLTGLVNPRGLAVDSSGGIYVADGSSILYFTPGSNGNVPPARVISGANTQITTYASPPYLGL